MTTMPLPSLAQSKRETLKLWKVAEIISFYAIILQRSEEIVGFQQWRTTVVFGRVSANGRCGLVSAQLSDKFGYCLSVNCLDCFVIS